ncbi:ATP-binding protein [Thermopolyspora sp. NPDC052614]|uniref:ATP-binding protein n=1 Tax=Thermopolyspora sp. NPDC052614 TaxID=3155682 RepID=UPI0034498B17
MSQVSLRKLRPTGLRGRLVITFTVVAVMASVLVASIAYQLVRQELLRRTEHAEVTGVRTVLERITLPIGTTDLLWPSGASVTEADLNAIVESLAAPDRQVVVRYGTKERATRDSTFRVSQIPLDLRRQAVTRLVHQRQIIDGVPYLVIGTQVQRETRGREHPTDIAVFVFVSLLDEERTLANLRTALLQAGSITLAIAAGVALLSARSVLLPVRRLGAAARDLGAGKLDTRLPVHGSDELAGLTATFNETAAALEQTVSELRTLESMSRRFVADVSHELRTPLTAMTAVTDMLSEEAERLPQDTGQAVRLVVQEIDRLRVLVEHLIETSRLDSGTAVLSTDAVDVGDALAECLRARGWSDQVKLNVPFGLAFSLDPRRFDVIMANLVGNALRHGAPPVIINARQRSDGLEVTVRDHGDGIPAEALPHVFDRFYKAEAGRSRSEGSGLGLAIAKANAELHHGTLTVRNANPGARFTLWIPWP